MRDCNHKTKPTGEIETEGEHIGKKITKCVKCGKEFVILHEPKKD